jgi:hypothetical protein
VGFCTPLQKQFSAECLLINQQSHVATRSFEIDLPAAFLEKLLIYQQFISKTSLNSTR